MTYIPIAEVVQISREVIMKRGLSAEDTQIVLDHLLDKEGRQVGLGVLINKDGASSANPQDLFAVLRIARHKGAGLALALEILMEFVDRDLPR